MEHSLHISTKHFVKSLTPHSTKKANNKDVGEDSNSEDEDELEAGNLLGKALALVKQLSFLLHFY
jgi:hypothetical protein